MNKEGRSILAERIGAERSRAQNALQVAMDSNLEVEVNRGASASVGRGERGREGGGWGGAASPGPGMSYAKPLSRPGRNHDRSSRQLPRGTASYTNSPPQHRV